MATTTIAFEPKRTKNSRSEQLRGAETNLTEKELTPPTVSKANVLESDPKHH